MKIQSIKIHPAAALALTVVFVTALAVPVYAIEGQDDMAVTTTSEIENESESETESADDKAAARSEIAAQKRAEIAKRREVAEAKVVANQEQVTAKLETKKLEMCQKRETKVQGIMQKIAERGERQVAVFTKISDRTEAFYATKGLTLANYGELVAAVDAAQVAADAQVAATKEISIDFDCEGENPLGVAAAFKASLEEQKAVLKDYKTAVKNLIVGVKSVASTTDTTTTDTGTTTETTEEGTN